MQYYSQVFHYQISEKMDKFTSPNSPNRLIERINPDLIRQKQGKPDEEPEYGKLL